MLNQYGKKVLILLSKTLGAPCLKIWVDNFKKGAPL